MKNGSKPFWISVRLLFGVLQMSLTVGTLILLAQLGPVPPVLWAFGAATLLTLLSLVLFKVLKVDQQSPIIFNPHTMKQYVAEFIGTFGLVFAGTGAIIINEVTGGAVSHVGIALTFGLVVLAMIYALGDISGAHLNPAVSIGFWLARRFPAKSVAAYILSQSAGAFAASGLLRVLFPQNQMLGATQPAGAIHQSFILEIVLTALLMFVILNVSTGAKEKGITAGMAVGSVIAMEALFAGPICGASMNPVRSLAPALVSGHLGNLWIYLVAPILGALLAVFACRCAREPDCCSVVPASPSA
jgi:aquaporin NIP